MISCKQLREWCHPRGVMPKKEVWERTRKLVILSKTSVGTPKNKYGDSPIKLAIISDYTIMLRCYAKERFSFVHLCWSYTQEIWEKYTSSSQDTMKKVWESFHAPTKVWESHSQTFPSHWIPDATSIETDSDKHSSRNLKNTNSKQ